MPDDQMTELQERRSKILEQNFDEVRFDYRGEEIVVREMNVDEYADYVSSAMWKPDNYLPLLRKASRFAAGGQDVFTEDHIEVLREQPRMGSIVDALEDAWIEVNSLAEGQETAEDVKGYLRSVLMDAETESDVVDAVKELVDVEQGGDGEAEGNSPE